MWEKTETKRNHDRRPVAYRVGGPYDGSVSVSQSQAPLPDWNKRTCCYSRVVESVKAGHMVDGILETPGMVSSRSLVVSGLVLGRGLMNGVLATLRLAAPDACVSLRAPHRGTNDQAGDVRAPDQAVDVSRHKPPIPGRLAAHSHAESALSTCHPSVRPSVRCGVLPPGRNARPSGAAGSTPVTRCDLVQRPVASIDPTTHRMSATTTSTTTLSAADYRAAAAAAVADYSINLTDMHRPTTRAPAPLVRTKADQHMQSWANAALRIMGCLHDPANVQLHYSI